MTTELLDTPVAEVDDAEEVSPVLPADPNRLYTADEFLWVEDNELYELVDGHLEERSMSARSSRTALRLMGWVTAHADAHRLGMTFDSDCTYQIIPGRPNLVRKPDGSFIRFGRFPNDELPEGHVRLVPDLALEVVSPTDTAFKVEGKIAEYEAAGVPLIWVVYPNVRWVYVYRAGQPVVRLSAADDLTGADILPGFTCRVADLFASPPPQP